MNSKKKIDLDAVLEELNRGQEETLAILRAHGHDLDLGEWISIEDYAKKYGLTLQQVQQLVEESTIPSACIAELPMFKNIRMIRDQIFMP